jgi:tRNA(fMet)-specific endonuclease VapC
VSEITILELIYGARKSEQYEKHIKDIQVIETLFTVIPIEAVYDRFALEKVKLKTAGKLIPDFDLLIGSTAAERDLIMVTNNERHLRRISSLSIENWTNPSFNKFADPNT